MAPVGSRIRRGGGGGGGYAARREGAILHSWLREEKEALILSSPVIPHTFLF